MPAKPLSEDEKAVVRDLIARHGGRLAVRPNEKAILIGERAFFNFISEWTDIVVGSCEQAVNRKISEELARYEK